MKLKAVIKNHEIVFPNIQYVRHFLSKLEGKKVTVEVEKEFNKRSNSQNNYYWLCLDTIAESTGNSSEELHRIFRGLYAPKKRVTLDGRVFHLPMSTTEMTKGQFVDYMLPISAEAGQLGIKLPDPKDLDECILL